MYSFINHVYYDTKLDRIGRFICGVLAIYGLVVVFGNMDDDPATEEKQEFLREEILEKGYDTNDFIVFLEEKKQADIENWTLDELRMEVKEFQKEHEPKKSEEEKNGVIDNVEEEENGDGSSGVEDMTPEVSNDAVVSNAEEKEGREAKDKSSSGEYCNWICFY